MEIFEFQISILKQEIDNLKASIRNWNSIFYVIKGWSITLFSGLFAIAMHLEKPNILFLAIVSSLMFWIIKSYARIVQKHFIS